MKKSFSGSEVSGSIGRAFKIGVGRTSRVARRAAKTDDAMTALAAYRPATMSIMTERSLPMFGTGICPRCMRSTVHRQTSPDGTCLRRESCELERRATAARAATAASREEAPPEIVETKPTTTETEGEYVVSSNAPYKHGPAKGSPNMKGFVKPPAGRDIEITRLAVEEHLDQDEIGKRFGIVGTRVSQILTKTTHRTQVMRFLHDRPGQRFTSREIAQHLRVDINKVQYVVDALRKRGKATFNKKSLGESGDHMSMFDIELTPSGMKEAEKVAALETVTYDPSKPNPEVEAAARAMAAKPAAVSAPPRPPQPAPRPPETPPPPPVSTNGAAAAPTLAPPPQAPTPPPPPAPTVPPRDEALSPSTFTPPRATLEAVPAADVKARVELDIAEIPRFPLIAQVTTRNEKLQAAAKLVESIGKYDDLAITILQRLDDFTDLEKEVLAYVAQHPKSRRPSEVDVEPVRREVLAVVKRWDMGPEQAAELIAAVGRGLDQKEAT